MHRYLTEMCTIIPELKNVDEITHINEGYSSEFKFHIKTKYNSNYLLRLTSAKNSKSKQFEISALNYFINVGVRCSNPLSYGFSVDQNCYYVLLSWLDGVDGSKALPSLSKEKQYDIGCFAAKDLIKIHSYSDNISSEDWKSRFLRKWRLNKEIYLQDSIRVYNDSFLIKKVDSSLELINSRPSCFLHDDFHLDNIVVDKGFYSGVIDFNRCTNGDPWHDFSKMFFYSSEISRHYCLGQLNTYFKKSIPSDFWELNSVYTIALIIKTLSWVKRSSPQHLTNMLNRCNRLIEEFNGFTNSKPYWFK